jgi:hypothetical protein
MIVVVVDCVDSSLTTATVGYLGAPRRQQQRFSVLKYSEKSKRSPGSRLFDEDEELSRARCCGARWPRLQCGRRSDDSECFKYD